MMDTIFIKRLEIFARHGVFKEENLLGQKFYVTAALKLDITAAAATDNLEYSVSYAEVCDIIEDIMVSHTWKLIEAAAGYLAEKLLETYPLLSQVDITLEKPSAPIPYGLETVSVSTSRAWHTAYIGIGSNVGDCQKNLETAIEMLAQAKGIEVLGQSSFYVTTPYGYTEQPPFLNGCLELKTYLSPERLLAQLNETEQVLGRKREIHWGPRTIDLDILLYDQLILDTKQLHIPHIDMANRMFVLKPLAEIAGFVRHPYLNQTIEQLCLRLEEKDNI